MKRIFDLLLVIVLIILLLIPILIIGLLVKITSMGGSVCYWSDRVGRGKNFKMPKFRSMCISTPQIATHLMQTPEAYLTLIGGFLRKTSLDELPQLWSVLKGDMSFVGPRPALFNQDDLIVLRQENGVDQCLPGITGWAQVNGRDELSIADKVALEVEYLHKQSFWFDLKILWLTILRITRCNGVSH